MLSPFEKLAEKLNSNPNRLHVYRVGVNKTGMSADFKIYLINDDYSVSDYTYTISTLTGYIYSKTKESITVRGCNFCKPDAILDEMWYKLQLTSEQPHFPAYMLN